MPDNALQIAETEGGAAAAGGATKAMAYSFGEPESVLDGSALFDLFEITHNGRWFEPPVPLHTLAKTFNMAPHHRSAIALKVNLLVGAMKPSAMLSKADFERFALDFLHMGNAYLEDVPSRAGGSARAKFAPARHMRAPKEGNAYWFVGAGIGQEHQFEPGRICHLQQPDVAQEIYGLPEWLPALQSGLLNESATLFRRRHECLAAGGTGRCAGQPGRCRRDRKGDEIGQGRRQFQEPVPIHAQRQERRCPGHPDRRCRGEG